MSKYWLGYWAGRRSGDGGGGLALLALIIAVIVGVVYVIYRISAAVGGFVHTYPLLSLVIVMLLSVFVSEGTPDSRVENLGPAGIVFVFFTAVFVAGYYWGGIHPDIGAPMTLGRLFMGVLAFLIVVSFLSFLYELVRYSPGGKITRFGRSAALTMIVWSLVGGLADASIPVIEPGIVLLAGLVLGVVVGVASMGRTSQA